jgi:hypothetical protein
VRPGRIGDIEERWKGSLQPSQPSASNPEEITVDLSLYGPVARAAGGHHIARRLMQLKAGATLGEMVAGLGLDREEAGYIFVNAVLCDVPGLKASRDLPLHDGDHVGIFSRVHMWPYQYRDGVRMTDSLHKALAERGPMHHSYASSAAKGRPAT